MLCLTHNCIEYQLGLNYFEGLEDFKTKNMF